MFSKYKKPNAPKSPSAAGGAVQTTKVNIAPVATVAKDEGRQSLMKAMPTKVSASAGPMDKD